MERDHFTSEDRCAPIPHTPGEAEVVWDDDPTQTAEIIRGYVSMYAPDIMNMKNGHIRFTPENQLLPHITILASQFHFNPQLVKNHEEQLAQWHRVLQEEGLETDEDESVA